MNNRVPEFSPMYLEYLRLAAKSSALSPAWLGGAGGAGGGTGGPPGGWIGQLVQSRVTYDTTEAAYTSGSSSLVDNLAHIRYQIANAQFNAGVAGVEFVQSEYGAADIDLGIGVDGGWVDVDATNAAVSITPQSAGTFQVTFGFEHQNTWTTVGDAEVWFRLTDGTNSLAPVKVIRQNFGSLSIVSSVISLSGLFSWANTTPRTIKLQKWTRTSDNLATNTITASGGTVVHKDVFRLGSIATGFIAGTGATGRVAYWTGGSALGSSSSFLWDTTGSRMTLPQISVTSGSLLMAGNMFKLAAPMEIDTTGAISGQVLGYDGVRWVPAVSSGSQAATTGSALAGQLALWSGTRVLYGFPDLDFTPGATNKISVGHAADQFALGLNAAPGDYVTLQVTQPSWVGGSDPTALIISPGILTAQTGSPAAFLSQSLSATWTNGSVPANWSANIFYAPALSATAAGGTMTTGTTVRIVAAPTSGSNLSVTNLWALEVVAGATYLGGPLSLAGKLFTLDAAMRIDPSGATNNQVLTYNAFSGTWIAQNTSASGGGGVSGISGSGAAARVAYFTSGSVIAGDARFNWDTTNQKLVIGDLPASVPAGSQSRVVILGDGISTGVSQFESGAVTPSFYVARSNGTLAAPSGLLTGDALGGFNAGGYGATAWEINPRARLQAVSAENWTDTAQGTYWSAKVTQPGTTTEVDAFDVRFDRVSITGYDLILDAAIELDPTSATVGEVLGFDGSKWVPILFSGISGITGSGTSGQVAYFTSGSVLTSDPFFFWDTSDSPRRLILGSSSSALTGAQLATVGGIDGAGISIEGYDTLPALVALRAGGNQTSPTSTLSGDILFRISARGYRSGAFPSSSTGRIDFIATESWTAGSQGTDLAFYTTGSGGATIVQGLRVRADSIDIVGKNLKLDAPIEFDSTGAVANQLLKFDGSKWVPFTAVGVSGISGSGTATQLAYFTSGSSLTSSANLAFDGNLLSLLTSGSTGGIRMAGDVNLYRRSAQLFGMGAGLQIDLGLNLGGATGAGPGQLRQSAASQVWAGSTLTLDASMELDPTGAASGQVLGYNGSKWLPVSAGGSGVSGSGASSQIAYFTSGSVITGNSNFTFNGLNIVSLTTSGSTPRLILTGFGSNASGLFQGIRARGTSASPAAVQSGDILFEFDALGYYSASSVSGIQAILQSTATENWTSGSLGTNWKFYVTAMGSPTLVGPILTIDSASLTLSSSVGLNLGTTGAIAGQLRQTSALQIWNGKTIQFDASMELDSTSAVSGQVLGYNGVKWLPVTSPGNSGISGLGAVNRIAVFTSGSVITGDPTYTFNDGVTTGYVYGGGDPPGYYAGYANGTTLVPTPTLSGDTLYRLQAEGYYNDSGSGFSPSGRIDFVAAHNFLESNNQTYLAFSTGGSDGSLHEDLRMDYAGMSAYGGKVLMDGVAGRMIAGGATLANMPATIFTAGFIAARVANNDSGFNAAAWSTTANVAPFHNTIRARGTSGSPGKVLNGDLLGRFAARGYYDDGAGLRNYTNEVGQLLFYAAEDYDDPFTWGSYASIMVTPVGDTTLVEALRVGEYGVSIAIDRPGSLAELSVRNNSLAPNSPAFIQLSTAGSIGSSDPLVQWSGSSKSWVAGMDISDGGRFKIGHDASDAGTNTILSLTSGSLVSWARTNQVWGGNAIQFDHSIEIDSTGATHLQVLAYNSGTDKWIPSDSGGSSAGGFFPSTAAISIEYFTVTVGDYLSREIFGSQNFGYLVRQNTPADGNSFEMQFAITSGSYTVSVLGYAGIVHGITDVYVDNNLVIAGADWYDAGGVFNTVFSGGVVLAGGVHTVKLTVNGKNPSSSDFLTELTQVTIT